MMSHQKLKVAVSGAAGLFGVNFFAQTNDQFEILPLINRKVIPSRADSCFNVNLFDPKMLREFILSQDVDIFLHCAALTDLEYCERHPGEALKVNTELTSLIAESVADQGKKMVFLSSDQVYGVLEEPAIEIANLKPVNVYGLTKAKAEEAVLKQNGSNLILRTNFFGWGLTEPYAFLDRINSLLTKRQSFSLWKDTKFNPLYLNNLIDLIVSLITENASGVLNVSSNECVSRFELGLYLAKSLDLDEKLITPSKLSDFETKVRRPNFLCLDNTKLRRLLGLNNLDTLVKTDKLLESSVFLRQFYGGLQ